MKTHMLSLRNNAVLIVLCIVFLFSQKANSQGKCSTASPLTIGANDSQCNSQNISGPTKLSNNSPPINTISGPSCGLASGTYSNWFSFTGDGTTIRVKTYAGNKIVGAVIFENQSCAGTMTAKSCATYADDGMPHVIDVPTTNGASYLVAIVGSSSTLAGKVCAYKTNGNPYSALCDPIIYTPPVSLPVKAKDNDCFSSYTNVVVSKTNPAPTTPCVGSTYANWWWGTFTATSTKTDLYLWGKDETNASMEVFEGPCGSSMNQVFCNNNTGAKDQPNWAGITTVPGKQYYVIIKATSSSTILGRLCVYNETVEAQKPACTADMSFEGGNSNGWQANWGSYHLVTEPGSTFTWDVTNTTKPANLYQVTSGTGRDAITSMIPVVAPGGGNNSFRIGSLGTAEGNMAVINGKSKSHSAATTAKYCFTVSASNAGFGYKYAVVMDCPFHPKELQPLFDVIMTLPGTGDTIKCGKFEHYPNDGTSPFNYVGSSTDVSGKSGIAFTPWTDVITDLSGYVGQTVCVTFRVRDCEGGNNMGGPLPAPYDSTSAGSHWAYAYFDTYCVPMKIDVPEFCAGAGSIQICAPAGYKSYSWPAGQPGLAGSPTTQCVTVTNPTQGNTYTVNMISISNCPTTAKVKLKIIPVAKTADTVLCGPGHAITLAVSVVDPTADPPYTYSWSNGLGTSSSVTTSPTVTTTYTVTITNKSGCSSTETITATVNVCGPSVLATGAKVCPGSCASITAAGSGGTAPYTYTWSDGKTGAGPQSFCPAATTIYTVTVKDANGATGTDTVIVAINPVMTLSTTSVNVMCQGANNGSAAVTVTGGTAVFTYTWASAGGTGATTTNTLSPGTYTVTVTDSKGCTKTATASITEPPALTAVPSAAPANCGSNTGTASVMAGGGTPTYIYSWMPGGGVSATITALAAGSYTVTITDSKGCSTSATALVNSTGGVTAAIISSVNATCITPGSAAVTATGGTAPYVISWSPVGGTGNTASNLSAGTYTVIVTDANNCISNTTVTITEPAGPQLATTKVDDNCGKGVGSATVISTAGLSPYTYLWNPGGITMPNANALFANTYTVSVTDANGCTATSTVVVANLNGPTANATSTDITCFGANNGTAQVTTTGGALPYTYSWQPPTSTVASITGLSPGTYTINVIDKAGCTSVSSVTITEPPKITISAVVKDANCNTTNGSIVVTASGGTGALTATWQPIGGPGFTANNLGAGSYTVTIVDASSCTFSSTVLVANVGAPTITTGPVTNILCKGGNNGSATISITGGTPGYVINWTPASAGTGTTISSLIAG
ncbi:MAG: hypothetical protein JNL63_08220, partial [Bacteroidia bacterium]|nr:hypothetical protein [Bacteroidia bacterium]